MADLSQPCRIAWTILNHAIQADFGLISQG
jgi:hypothetical protein